MERAELLAGFARHLAQVRGRSAATVRSYLRDVGAFLNYLDANNIALQQGLTRPRAGLYLMQRTEARRRQPGEAGRIASRSAARALSALNALAQYLVFSGELGENALSGMHPPKYSRKLPPYLSVDELKLLLAAYAGQDGALALRNTALLTLLYATGLRVSECAGLDLGSLKFDERTLRVIGKGNKARETPFGAVAAEALQRYIAQARPALATAKSGEALWLNARGGRLSTRAMWDVLDQAVLKAGLVKHLSPHKLRHACATHMLEGGADVRLLQEFLGHESLNTTQIYTQVTMTRLREVYEQAHPRAKR
jgi:integrase/recombinase XerD